MEILRSAISAVNYCVPALHPFHITVKLKPLNQPLTLSTKCDSH